ncbi:LytTR family DNA-binding domain-containing protein [Brevundimonas sp. 2R-24]|uniref:LytTR family DNA-binding domain-containing protein n=1 Tax=Peiella sedimenti TaxID=3061083 RepID=A0ABT8SJV7_9CAUL|nr:LytTR family DNA-binding domain-containing protein [Caulobacteraceae bacterium XZ-24]
MKALIVDDEPLALDRLELDLECVAEVTEVARARNGAEALSVMTAFEPDLLLLDIEMPGRDGLQVAAAAAALPHPPDIVFVTAHREHALQAFELEAVDYLLKPVSFERLRTAVRRAAERRRARGSDERFAQLQEKLAELSSRREGEPERPRFEETLWAPDTGGAVRIRVDDVECLLAEGDYVSIYTPSGSKLVRETLTAMQTRLDPARFLRVHRSAIVALSQVRSLRRRTGKGATLILNSGRTVAVGPSYAADVVKALGLAKTK